MDAELFSPQLDETRRIKVYLPLDHSPAEDWPVLFLADGIMVDYVARWVEPMIQSGAIPRMVLVGLLSGQPGIVEDRSDVSRDLRAADYLPNRTQDAPHRFRQHLDFVTETVLPWAQKTHGAGRNGEKIAVTGFSNGGVFALHAGYRRPGVFDLAIVQSPGVGTIKEANEAPTRATEFWISAGAQEPHFLISAIQSAEALEAAGYVVRQRTYIAGHAMDQWDQGLSDALQSAFADYIN